MKIKVYNYALWRDEASGAYFTKVNGTSVEISKEVYYELMKHENEDRYKKYACRISGCANPPFVLRIIHIADFGFSEQKTRHRKITAHSWKKAAESSIKGGWI